MVDNTVGGKDRGGQWHHDVSLQLESLASFSSFSTFLMAWTLVLSHTIEAVKHFNVPIIKTADHTPALITEHLSWDDISIFHQLSWSPPSQSTMSSTINTKDLKMVTHVKDLGNWCQPLSPQRSTTLSKNIQTEVMHPNVSDPSVLFLLLVLAVHGVVNHQITQT